MITVLDLRLRGRAPELPLQALARLTLPWVYASLAVTMVTGVVLFFYDPLAVGSHDWLTPKLLFIALVFTNASYTTAWGTTRAVDPVHRRARHHWQPRKRFQAW